jgi:integrase
MAQRKPKGDVSVEEFRGFLRLRWRVHGKRYSLSLGLPDDFVNRQVAEQKANAIRLDIISDNFDPTLLKYRSEQQSRRALSAVKLFQRFIKYKARQVQERTLEKYEGLVTWLKDFYGDGCANEKNAEEFILWLGDNMKPVTAKERLGLLKACWDWGIQEELVSENPWQDLKVQVQPRQMPKPFTLEEVQAIVQTFRDHSRYRHYADYIQFKFETGCRTGEANGLKWRHLNDKCSVVWFGEAHTHRKFKEAKRGKAREFKLAESTSKMLLARRSRLKAIDEDALVFPAPKGGAIDEGNFAEREWTSVLEHCGVHYLRPYHTRHTFISHCLEQGMNPVNVAQMTGHNVKTLYERYAGIIVSTPRAPELFSLG